MKERLVEDWLTRINERGYQTAFGQSLLWRGFRVLRIGHSAYEHGKDVLAVSEQGEVHCYQLKDQDIGIKEWERDYGQTCALVEARPSHPALATDYVYRPFIVTNGRFTDPVLDRIVQHNTEWERRGLPKLTPINGKELHRDLVELSSDFWPVEPPDVRAFRSLYLVDGRGDFVVDQFAQFMNKLLGGELSPKELDRHAAAANVFTSYLLGEFYRQGDHWSVFRGWILCGSCIAAAAERHKYARGNWQGSFTLAKEAALEALGMLAEECETESAFATNGLELDEYVCLRNTVTLGAWATYCLVAEKSSWTTQSGAACAGMTKRFIPDGRLWFWGESALPTLLAITWLLEREGETAVAQDLLIGLIQSLVISQQPDSVVPFPDPYISGEDVLKMTLENLMNKEPRRPKAILSYALLPLVLLMVRRGLRNELESIWRDLSRIRITFFSPDHSWGYLQWNCDEGVEQDQFFKQPQSWAQLVELANSPKVELLPEVLRADRQFALMFLLAVPHRLVWSIIGILDDGMRTA